MSNITSTDVTEKRISLVYNSEISGFQALDFSKIDGIEGILNNTIVTGENIPSGITVYQANLDKDLDNVSVYVSGQALDYLSSLVTGGISLKGINTVNVNVTGGSLNVINEVEIKNEQNNPVLVSGTVTANLEQQNFTDALSYFCANTPEVLPVGINSVVGNLPISGTVTAGNIPVFAEPVADFPCVRIGGVGTDGFVPVQIKDSDGYGILFNNGNLPISGTVTANVIGTYQDENQFEVFNKGIGLAYTATLTDDGLPHVVAENKPLPVRLWNSTVTVGNSVTIGSLPAISGTVTANVPFKKDYTVSPWESDVLPVQIISPNNGEVLGGSSNPLSVFGTVTSKIEKSSTISNSTISGTNGTVLGANANRLELFVQNLATGALFIKYGANASNTSFNFVLAANSATNAGDGGSLSDQAYTGVVSVSGVSPSYISWERS